MRRSASRDGAYPSPGPMIQDAPAAPRPLPGEPADAHTGRLNRYVPRALLEHLVETPEMTVRSEDGTMVFVDISGFTKLSERLARAGREGAEHLVDTISACFSTLLAEAYAERRVAAEVRRRRAARCGSRELSTRIARLLLCDRDAPHASADRPDPRGREQHRPADVGRRAQRALRDVPGRRVPSRVPDRRPVGEHADGARVGGPGGPDPGQRPDRRAAPRSLPRRALGAGCAARPRPRDTAVDAQGRCELALRCAGRAAASRRRCALTCSPRPPIPSIAPRRSRSCSSASSTA